MVIPLGDEPNPRGVPVVTYGLILVNVLVYLFISLPLSLVAPDANDPRLAEYLDTVLRALPEGVSPRAVLDRVSAYDLFTFTWGYRPVDPSLVTLVTAMFLHGGFLHLAGNMLFLWIYGDNVEHRLGALPFLFWYLVTGAAATLFHAWFFPTSPLPLVGASGAISGVLGFYFVWFPHNRVRLWIWLFPWFADVVLVPARIVLGLYLVVENLLPFVLIRELGATGVAYGAHIGGFLAGLLVAWGSERRATMTQPRAYRRAASSAATRGGSVAPGRVLRDLLTEGRFADAAALYFSLPAAATRRILSPDDSLALAEWLRASGHLDAAVIVYQRHLRDYPLGPGAAEAHAGLGLIQLHALDQPAAAYQHFVEALELDPSPSTEAVVRQALAEILARQKFRVGRRLTLH